MEKLTEEELQARILDAKAEITKKVLHSKQCMRRLDGDGYRSMVEQIAYPNQRAFAGAIYQIQIGMLGD